MIEPDSASLSISNVCCIFNKAEQLFNLLSESIQLDEIEVEIQYLRLNLEGN